MELIALQVLSDSDTPNTPNNGSSRFLYDSDHIYKTTVLPRRQRSLVTTVTTLNLTTYGIHFCLSCVIGNEYAPPLLQSCV